MRISILALVLLLGLSPGCSKPIATWTVEDVEGYLVKNIPLESVELEEVTFCVYAGTATCKGKRFTVSAELNHFQPSLIYSMKGETAQLSQSGGFELMDAEKALSNLIVTNAIILSASALIVFCFQKKFGAASVSKWGIIAILGLAVVLIAVIILKLVQG